MSARSIVDEVEVQTDPQQTFDLLITPSAIRAWWSASGPLPFELDARVEFEVLPSPEGSVLRVTQSGFPADAEADEYYAGCVKGWSDTLGALRRHARDVAKYGVTPGRTEHSHADDPRR